MSATDTNINKFKALETLFQSVEKQFGKGTIMRLSDDSKIAQEIQVIPTGSLSLDVALGVGGLPKGRVVEIYGTESSGKTTLTLHAIAECQKKGGIAAFIDAEHALDVSYARKIGVSTSDLLVSQPDNGEQALEIVDMLVRSGAVDLIVVDSVAALTPKSEIEGEMGDSHMGLQARLMSQALRKLTGSISKTNCCVIFINQVRMKIGIVFGNPETTTGGQALKFYSTVRLEVRKAAAIKNANDTIGHRTKVKVVKNKVAAPFKEVEFDIMFGHGISKEGDVLDLASAPDAEIIQKSGTWFTYNGERLGQGRENAKEYLREHPETMAKIEAAVRARANLIRNPSNTNDENVEDSTIKSLPGATQALPSTSSKPGRRSSAGASVSAE
ncbi:recombinase RecA [Fluviispira multicolorata]|uniref:Protein RecA n=1 Tax=Fluviispira multicolorata TaxID=2654512 RepID=A0A833N5L0_9BACT|nr:recombinase RecA [Fluviispira multicolorata]KAB8033504.1 recombinase RecA [Fluviispira multicolorata]